MSKQISFVRVDIAKFLLRVYRVKEGDRGAWLTGLADALAEGARGVHPYADELLEEAEEFAEAVSERQREKANKRWEKNRERQKDAAALPRHTEAMPEDADICLQASKQASKQAIEDISLNLQPEEGAESEKVTQVMLAFDEARKAFPGSKRGLQTEWANFKKKNGKDAARVVPLLLPAIRLEKKFKDECARVKAFVAPWKNFQTWINQRCWEQEFPAEVIVNGR